MTADVEPVRHEPSGTGAKRPDRRLLIGSTLAAITLGATAGLVPGPAIAATITDTDRLNFLLNLEYVQAEFYNRAAFGQVLASNRVTGTGTLGAVTGGSQVTFTDQIVAAYAREIAQDHIAHLDFLRTTLGGLVIARPAIEFTASFTNAAIAAGYIVAGQTFNPFTDDMRFLLGAFFLNDVVVTAYQGVLLQMAQTGPYYASLSGMMVVEGYHAAILRTELYIRNGGVAANLFANLRGVLGGGNEVGLVTRQGVAVAPLDANAVAYGRTSAQVLSIFYGSVGGRSGLFFPSGVNGAINAGA